MNADDDFLAAAQTAVVTKMGFCFTERNNSHLLLPSGPTTANYTCASRHSDTPAEECKSISMPTGLAKSLPFAAWTRALLAPALVFIATAGDRNYQTDFWHHLARGRAMAESGTFVDHDQFTY